MVRCFISPPLRPSMEIDKVRCKGAAAAFFSQGELHLLLALLHLGCQYDGEGSSWHATAAYLLPKIAAIEIGEKGAALMPHIAYPQDLYLLVSFLKFAEDLFPGASYLHWRCEAILMKRSISYKRKRGTTRDHEVLAENKTWPLISQGEENSDACPICGRTFMSAKALHGHMRCHPERSWRGVNPPPSNETRELPWSEPAEPSLNWNWGRKAKRGREGKPAIPNDPLILAAYTLCLLRLGRSSRRDVEQRRMELVSNYFLQNERDIKDESAQIQCEKRYSCSLCEKSFSSFQALGGHRASHNKNKEAKPPHLVDLQGLPAKDLAIEHRCKMCGMVFPTGQALGGHMRKHWLGKITSIASSSLSDMEAVHVLTSMDLTELAKNEDGEL